MQTSGGQPADGNVTAVVLVRLMFTTYLKTASAVSQLISAGMPSLFPLQLQVEVEKDLGSNDVLSNLFPSTSTHYFSSSGFKDLLVLGLQEI